MFLKNWELSSFCFEKRKKNTLEESKRERESREREDKKKRERERERKRDKERERERKNNVKGILHLTNNGRNT